MIHTMKNIVKFITLGIALLAGTFAANAQTWNKEGGVATAKTVSAPDENGLYTIKLETYATGESTITETGIPVDIVLVLDVSGSMSDPMTSYTYTARNNASYNYNNYTTTYYYLHTDGQYYAVERERPYVDYQRRYRLYYDVGNTRYYLSGTGVTTTAPTNITGAGTTIWTGVLYSRSSSTQTKIAALRSAVSAFVNEVHHNALYDSKNKLRGTPLDNQISIVKFAADRYCNANGRSMNTPYTYDGQYADVITPGNHRGAKDDSRYNYTEVYKGFTDVSTNAGVSALSTAAINEGGATAADFGMQKAIYLLQTVQNRNSNKVVVMFTDGEPNHSRGWDPDVATATINIAHEMKTTYGATVFTVGVFESISSDLENYMHYTSSNYPDATGMGNPGSGSDKGYYQNASEADLTAIFKHIASSASQSDATVGESTQIRDVVSSSFILPEGASADDVTIYTMDITENGNGWENQQTPAGVTAVYKTATGSDGVERKMLSVEGFDFTKPDTKDPNTGYPTRETAGNFVGERYKSETETFWAGKKLVIEFKVQANDQATGGNGSATNHSDSGVYLYNEETDTYTNINHYPVPHTNLPLIIKIKKDGLRHGESATFEVQRCAPLVVDGEVQYNAIGKPLPDPNWIDPVNNPDQEKGFHTWTKVIITNKEANGDPVTKVLYALDPYYVYKVIEDDWGWAYTLSGTSTLNTTSDVEINPFTFHNEEKEGVVKHAEAVSINHFATSAEGEASTEEYHSSKVEHF